VRETDRPARRNTADPAIEEAIAAHTPLSRTRFVNEKAGCRKIVAEKFLPWRTSDTNPLVGGGNAVDRSARRSLAPLVIHTSGEDDALDG
jgi:hypothetical protein